ncbi:hypothetical protein [Paraflavitalea speifideaquila]|uniref:PIN domain-containing protein n=1 Tax=Paraflavitalea speifideaquila TaxID=3076558 RepID=UPI0028EF0266|nr:hypothetical protein [Paraflavitalea speifideiaquila]
MLDLLNNQKPSHMAVAFDTHAPTERHTEFADYKANRQETPEDLKASIPDIKRIIRGFNIPIVELDGYEADDVIGTLSKQAAKEGFEVYMVTPIRIMVNWWKKRSRSTNPATRVAMLKY